MLSDYRARVLEKASTGDMALPNAGPKPSDVWPFPADAAGKPTPKG
jgi:hypothetical protein